MIRSYTPFGSVTFIEVELSRKVLAEKRKAVNNLDAKGVKLLPLVLKKIILFFNIIHLRLTNPICKSSKIP